MWGETFFKKLSPHTSLPKTFITERVYRAYIPIHQNKTIQLKNKPTIARNVMGDGAVKRKE